MTTSSQTDQLQALTADPDLPPRRPGFTLKKTQINKPPPREIILQTPSDLSHVIPLVKAKDRHCRWPVDSTLEALKHLVEQTPENQWLVCGGAVVGGSGSVYCAECRTFAFE